MPALLEEGFSLRNTKIPLAFAHNPNTLSLLKREKLISAGTTKKKELVFELRVITTARRLDSLSTSEYYNQSQSFCIHRPSLSSLFLLFLFLCLMQKYSDQSPI